MSMFKQCLERKEGAKEDHIWHEMSPSRIILVHHRMLKFPRPVFLRLKSLYGNVIETLNQAVIGVLKGKKPRCITHFQWPTKSFSPYWSRITGFLLSPQSLKDLHIQEDTMSMPHVNTMEESRDTPWRIARLSKTRFNPWSTQIRSNSENLLVVIRSIKMKDLLGAVFVCLLITNVFVCGCTFEICKLCSNVSICMKWMNFWFQTSLSFWILSILKKKGNKFRDHKVSTKKMWKCFQVLNNGDFKMIGDHC